jgi:hypothetical protein
MSKKRNVIKGRNFRVACLGDEARETSMCQIIDSPLYLVKDLRLYFVGNTEPLKSVK